MPRIDEETKRQRKARILSAIQNHNGIRESELAEYVGLERRTVNNYLRELDNEGQVYQVGRLWHAAFPKPLRLRPFELSPEEAMTLYLATRLLVKQHDKRNEPAETALLKLAEVLTADLGVGQEIRQAAQELAGRNADPRYQSVFRTIVQGYIYRRRVDIHYKPLNKPGFDTSFATYLIEPSAIGYSTYLIGHSRMGHFQADRAYKLERIAAAKLSREAYTIPPDFPGLEILRNAWSIITGEPTRHVVLRFSPAVAERVLETRWHPSQDHMADPDRPGYLRWWVDVADTMDMLPWIRGWGADVEVLEPDPLREEVKMHVYRLNRLYQLPPSSSDPHTPLLRLWGKTTADPELFHPALYHMFDVAHVAQHLLSERATPRWRQVLARALNVDADNLGNWLPWIVALHDIGKISPPFQAQNGAQRQRLEAEGVSFGRYAPEHKALHHTLTGRMGLVEWARALPYGWGEAILAMIAGHHGVYQSVSVEHRRLAKTLEEPEMWATWREQARDLLRQHLLLEEPPAWSEPTNVSAAIAALNGFTILCDWLGSDGDYFEPQPYLPLQEYLAISRRRAEKRVEHAGFFIPSASGAPATFAGLFGWRPRPLQEAIDHIPDHLLARPTLTIIEAPTGEGKTEAALTLARRIARHQGTDELYVALPTTATSNAMYKRLREHLLERLSLPPELIQLVHGQAFLVMDDLSITPLSNGDGEPHPAQTWFEPKKRALLAPFGVGTVDQAELAALNVRHNALRLIGLAGKVVILDEVHAYDTYMTTIIARMLQWLAALGSSVILLSATLPIARRRQLAEAYGGQMPPIRQTEEEVYPYLLTVGAAGYHEATPDAEEKQRDIHLGLLHFEEEDWAGKAQWLLDQAQAGGCVCWIANTVRRAQQLFAALSAIAPDDVDCTLLHAQFPLDDRQRIEDEIAAKFGKESSHRPQKGVVVGTQVLEQSLDIDFDVMVTDLAPIDLVLQRAGRLHRHKRDRPTAHAEPRLYVNYERDETGQPRPGPDKFYGPYLLLKSWEAIGRKAANPGFLRLPEEYRPLIEAVYSEVEPGADDPWREAWQKQTVKDYHYQKEAEIRLTREPDPEEPFYEGSHHSYHEDEDSAGWMNAQTRFQEREMITVIPIERVDLECGRIPGLGDLPLNRAADRRTQLRLLRRSVRLGNPKVVPPIKAAARPALFTESPLLKRCYPLWLVDGVAEGLPLRLDPQLGVVIEKGVAL